MVTVVHTNIHLRNPYMKSVEGQEAFLEMPLFPCLSISGPNFLDLNPVLSFYLPLTCVLTWGVVPLKVCPRFARKCQKRFAWDSFMCWFHVFYHGEFPLKVCPRTRWTVTPQWSHLPPWRSSSSCYTVTASNSCHQGMRQGRVWAQWGSVAPLRPRPCVLSILAWVLWPGSWALRHIQTAHTNHQLQGQRQKTSPPPTIPIGNFLYISSYVFGRKSMK